MSEIANSCPPIGSSAACVAPCSASGSGLYVARVCLVAALGGLLFGYDTAVIAGAIGNLRDHFHLSAAMTGWAASCALVGCAIGVAMAGVLSDRAGRRQSLVLSGLFFFVSALGTAIPDSIRMFVIFRILGGMGVGIASMTSPMYIAEITPGRIRGRMVAVNQFAIVSGMLIIYFVNYFIARAGDDAWNLAYGWRWMFASGVAPSLVFLLLLATVPESPRWLIEHRRPEAARVILERINGPEAAAAEIAAISQSTASEAEAPLGLASPAIRPALAIGIALAVLQQITGINVFLYYAPEIFKQLGSGGETALLETIVVGAVNLTFTVIAIWTVDRLGRRLLMILGAAGMGISLVAMGLAAQLDAIAAWSVVIVLGYIACFAVSVGPVTWVILSEIFPTSVRSRALSIATLALWTANFLVSQTFPMMNENSLLVGWFHHAFPFYIYAVFCVVLIAVVWRFVPETKGRSLEEIERSWTRQSA